MDDVVGSRIRACEAPFLEPPAAIVSECSGAEDVTVVRNCGVEVGQTLLQLLVVDEVRRVESVNGERVRVRIVLTGGVDEELGEDFVVVCYLVLECGDDI